MKNRRVAIVTTASILLTCAVGTGAQAQDPSVQSHAASSISVEKTASEPAVHEVVEDGVVVGYALDAETQASLNALRAEMLDIQGPAVPGVADGSMSAMGFFDVAKCVGALAGFVALTVFPTARAAKLAVRIGKMINKHGINKTAQILTRTYKGSDVNSEQIFKEIAKEAAGIGALSLCGF